MNNSEGLHRYISNSIRMLWMQHSEWTRMAFASIIFKNPDEKEVLQRLLRNPVDFAYFLSNFVGWQTAFSFGDLLTEHLNLATALVRATMSNNTEDAEKINKQLYENADSISALLSSAKPCCNYDEWRTMLYRHLDLAKKMASEMINDDYEESILTYDNFEAEAMLMADMMTECLLYCSTVR